MSSSTGHLQGSPPTERRRSRSQFTYRQLSLLASYSTASPLRVIAHIDLDCFYCQVEQVRLGVSEDQPFAVQQWANLIAVNYPARASGVSRHISAAEAKKLCPNLETQHVATWREGEQNWSYHADAAENMATHKVSLDPYRLESERIMALIKGSLPRPLQRVEKASIDEVFLDLSAHVHSVLVDRFPELSGPPPNGDPNEKLPMPPVLALDWKADALVAIGGEGAEMEDPDWDDVAVLLGSEIVRDVRAAIKEKLRYTCSAGVATNKMLSKLGSGYRKPNAQTVIRNRAVGGFLSEFKFTKIRNLGGRLGQSIVDHFGTDTVEGLLGVSVEELRRKLNDDTGVWVYETIRGVDRSEVRTRVETKSLLSAKSFRPGLNNLEQGVRWLRVFVADLYSRLVEGGTLEHKRFPRSLTIHHRHGAQTRSRQTPIRQPVDERALLDSAKLLLSQIAREGNAWPCANLSLSVSNFEDGAGANHEIDGFLVRGGGDAPAARASPAEEAGTPTARLPAAKRRRADDGGIQRFFPRMHAREGGLGPDHDGLTGSGHPPPGDASADEPSPEGRGEAAPHGGMPITYSCPRCNAKAADEAMHMDWHLAKDLQEQERARPVLDSRRAATPDVPLNTQRSVRKRKGSARREAGQSRLKFG